MNGSRRKNLPAVNVLVVEDNEMNRDMLSRRLKRRGYEVHTAVDGFDALKNVAKLQPEIILMDMNLPGLDGWETTKRIKADPDFSSIKIIALTAHAMGEDRQRAFDVGCDDFDVKPIDFKRLISKIQALSPNQVEQD
jgi:CheY-like chemotaxis protein